MRQTLFSIFFLLTIGISQGRVQFVNRIIKIPKVTEANYMRSEMSGGTTMEQIVLEIGITRFIYSDTRVCLAHFTKSKSI